MTIRMSRDRLPLHARQRAPGFAEAIAAAASWEGDTLTISHDEWRRIAAQHRLPNPPNPQSAIRNPQLHGLGDLVAVVAQPIARAIDRVAGTDIEHCGGCAQRRAAHNRVRL